MEAKVKIILGLPLLMAVGCVSNDHERAAADFFKAYLDGDMEVATGLSIDCYVDGLASDREEETKCSWFQEMIGGKIIVEDSRVFEAADLKLNFETDNGLVTPIEVRLWKLDGEWKVAMPLTFVPGVTVIEIPVSYEDMEDMTSSTNVIEVLRKALDTERSNDD